MTLNDEQAWLSELRQHKPASLSFYQFRVAELAANKTEAAVKDDGKDWMVFWEMIERAHTQALSELRKKHPSFKGISQIPLEPIPMILKRHWKYAGEVM